MVMNSVKSLIPKVLSGSIALTVMLNVVAFAQSEVVIYNFKGGAGGYGPSSQLVFDKAGNLYGTTAGGSAHTGSIFKLTKH